MRHCISSHNANIEKCFSFINAQWTKDWSKLNVQFLFLLLQSFEFFSNSLSDNAFCCGIKILTKINRLTYD